ncbi:50S ribosomal protein P1 [Ferroplasma sp.]|jgi:large subunit ribosomal protein L12|uniref:50S ribosomal protein P1 n=1 Tax=Ferroplasma sp. TaxID=2591003 RepID=UPI0026284041|nr:50S ribosomal protein P1 [Ferroplasma sp.]MCL4452959.1 50S ribosomal protein P1 [Candidatus Thermoplasmatota archaeon]WMT51738.1 MAG: 50S ribosomal protein P1 [Ferroplasma sp.]
MEYIYGALLLHSAGKEIDEENLKKVLTDAGVSADDARLKSLLESMKNVNIEDVLKSAAAAPVAAAPAKEEKKEEKKKEEKKEEKKEDSDADAMAGLSSLFG